MSNADLLAALLRQAIDRSGPIVPTQDDWPTWLWTARWERVVPLLHRLVDRTPTDLTDDQRSEARQAFGAVMCRCVQLEHHLVETTRLLDDHGIRSVALKGGATAHVIYPDATWREFSDIDLLVSPADRPRAVDIVQRHGWEQEYPLPASHEQFTHAITFAKDDMELDLHQRVAHRALGRLIPAEQLVARAVPFSIAGTEVLALEEIDRFIHSAVHAVGSGPGQRRLSSLSDVLRVVEDRPDLAPGVQRRSEEYRVRSLVERAVEDSCSAAQLPIPRRWAEFVNGSVGRRDRLVDRAYLDSRRRPLIEEMAHLRLLENWTERVRYLSGFLSMENTSTTQRIGYLWSKVRNRS